MESKKRNSLLLMVLLLLIGITALYVAGTYAKYTAEFSGTGTAQVAKWAFKSENESKTIDIDLTENYDPSTLVADRIAPGTSGSFDIALTNEDSEVGVDFTVSFGNVTNKPTNLKFYKDASFNNELDPANDTITGKLAAEDATGVTVKVYWKWLYETGAVTNGIATGDAADTTNGETPASLTVPMTIKGVQTAPSEKAITSHID